MKITDLIDIAPNTVNVTCKVKVIEKSMKLTTGKSVNEYLLGDETAMGYFVCFEELHLGSWYQINHVISRMALGCIRLWSEPFSIYEIEPEDPIVDSTISTRVNISTIEYEYI
jgi:hypothetical protein